LISGRHGDTIDKVDLERRGRYLLLPLSGEHITAVDGGVTARFSDGTSTLHVHGDVVLRLASDPSTPVRTKGLGAPTNPLIGVPIREALARDRRGELLVCFEDGSELVVEDGPFENWQYIKVNPDRPRDTLRVNGGVGRTTFA
jgi:hypothetical protein